MNWEHIRERLLADKGQWSRIARETGLHVNGVRKLALGETPTPRIDTAQKIADYYRRKARRKPAQVREAA